MILRVPNFRDNYKRGEEQVFRGQVEAITTSAEVFEAFTRELEATTDFRTGGAYEELRVDLIQSLPGLQFDEASSIRALRHLETFFGILNRMRWRRLRTKGNARFVTSDNPVAVFHPVDGERGCYGLGLELPNTEITFPLSRTMAVVAAWDGPPALPVEEVNERTIIVAERYVFGPRESPDIARLVRKYANSAPRTRVRTSTSRQATGEVQLTIETSALQPGGESRGPTNAA